MAIANTEPISHSEVIVFTSGIVCEDYALCVCAYYADGLRLKTMGRTFF